MADDDFLTDLRGPHKPLPRDLTDPSDLRRDPDEDELPAPLDAYRPLYIRGRDRDSGEPCAPTPTTAEHVASGMADLRRSREDD